MRTSWKPLLPLLAFLALAASGAAQQISLGQQRALLLVRLLEQDKNLGKRVQGPLVVGVLYQPGHPESEAVRRELSGILQGVAKKTKIGGRPLQVLELPYSGPAELETRLAGQQGGAAALYVGPGFDPLTLLAVSAIARQSSVLTITPLDEYVRLGLGIGLVQQTTVGVVEQTARIALLINLPAVQAEGAELKPELLKLAEVLR